MHRDPQLAYNIDERYQDCEALLPIIEQLRKAGAATTYGRAFIEDLIMGDNLLDARVPLYDKLSDWAELSELARHGEAG